MWGFIGLVCVCLAGCQALVGIEDYQVPVDGAQEDSSSAGCVSRCDSDVLVTCEGQDPSRTPCSVGCAADPQPHCVSFVASNTLTEADLEGVSGALAISAAGEVRINTDTGEIVKRIDDGLVIVRKRDS